MDVAIRNFAPKTSGHSVGYDLAKSKRKSKGECGELEIFRLLVGSGIDSIRKADWIFQHPQTNECFYLEIKNKEPYEPPPAYLQGFPEYQYSKDMQIDGSGITAIYVVRGKQLEWLAQLLSKLVPLDLKINVGNEKLVWFNLEQFIPFERLIKRILETAIPTEGPRALTKVGDFLE